MNDLPVVQDFIGTGWKFPVEFSRETGTVEMLFGEADIKSSLDILFATSMGERVMRPDYGSSLSAFLFASMNTATLTYMEAMIRKAILFHEPRIKADVVEITTAQLEEGRIDINVSYTIMITNNRYNYVYPFYVNEATNLKR